MSINSLSRNRYKKNIGKAEIILEEEMNPVFRFGSTVLVNADCAGYLSQIPEKSIDLVVTDPPYFLDGMGNDWNDGKLASRTAKSGVVGGLPAGMKFDRRQGPALYDFMLPVAQELIRVLKPGGFCIVFSQARLYHRMAMALEDAGFEIRDMLAWKYEGQAKAFSQTHFILGDKRLSAEEKERLCKEMAGYKTPQLKPQMEPMVLAQKPRIGTFVENWQKFGVGLVNFSVSLDGRCPGNVMEIAKQAGKRSGINHLTVKPVSLISHLIGLFSREGHTVLDPFAGSGSHGIAALKNRRKFIGIEKEPRYWQMAMERIKAFQDDQFGNKDLK